MASDGVEIARAFVTLIPSFEGAQSKLTEQLMPTSGLLAQSDKAATSAATSFGSKFKTVLAPLMGATAVVGAFKGLYEVGEIFDEVTDTIRIGTGATGDALDAMTESAKNIGKTVPTSFQEAAVSVADWNTRMGLSGKALEDVAAQTEMLKSMDMAADINTLSAAFNAFNIEGESVSGSMDTLFQVSQATGVSMDSLASGVQKNAPALQSLGFGFEDAAAMVGVFDKAGLNSQQVMSAMSKGLVTLAKDGEEPQEAFKRVVGEIQSFMDAGDEAAALDLASKVFGTRGATQMIGALKDSTINMNDLMASAGATGDTIMGVGLETMDFGEKWQIVKNNALAALEPLGSAVFDGLGQALDWVMPYLERLGNWMADNTTTVAVVAGVVGGVLTAAFFAWAGSIVATNLALLASPITWIILGIVALGAGLVALIANWDSVVAWISNVWSTAVQWVKDSFASIGDWFTSVGETISGFLSGLWDTITSTMSTVWTTIVQSVSNFVTQVVSFITSLPGRAVTALASFGSGIIRIASSAWQGFLTTVTNFIGKIVSSIGGLPGKAVSALSNLGSKLKNKATSAFNTMRDQVSTKITEVVGKIKELPSKALEGLGNLGSYLKNSGAALIDGFKNGITSAFRKVKTAVTDGLGKIRKLFPFSPAKEGPFSGRGWVLYSGLSIGDAMAEGISRSIPGAVREAELMAGLTQEALSTVQSPTLKSGVDLYGSDPMSALADRQGSTTINVTLDINDLRGVRTAEELVRNLSRYKTMLGA